MELPAPKNETTEGAASECPAILAHLKRNGVRSLSDAELLAVIICGAVSEQTAWTTSVRLFHGVGRSFHGLKWLTQLELMRRHGLTERQAAVLIAALEMGRRRTEEPVHDRPLVATSSAAYALLKPVLSDLPHEEFWVLMLDRGNRVLDTVRVSVGGLHGTVADPKTIFKLALDHRASSIVLAHNHPSGQLRPSTEDLSLTKKLVEAGKVLDITAQDHLIIGHEGWYSFADQGMM